MKNMKKKEQHTSTSEDLLNLYVKLKLTYPGQFSVESWNYGNFKYTTKMMTNKKIRHTCYFVCPISGIYFPCGFLVRCQAVTIDGLHWYKTSRKAQQAATARVFDYYYSHYYLSNYDVPYRCNESKINSASSLIEEDKNNITEDVLKTEEDNAMYETPQIQVGVTEGDKITFATDFLLNRLRDVIRDDSSVVWL